MAGYGFFDGDSSMGGMYSNAMLRRAAMGPPRRFDEFYRCYPVAMYPGKERENINYGGKVLMPPSALDKLTRLEITYPMLFELVNGPKERTTHAGVLEFIAEEGKIYLPFWIMQTLLLEPGELVQIKSTDLPSGSFIKLQAQSISFLEISDPKAVLENTFRNFSCLTTGDVFTFAYNDQTYEMAVLETKPSTSKNAISVLETDLEVDFAAPVGYEEPKRPSGTSTPRSGTRGPTVGGTLHNQGTMAQAINYASIAPSAGSAGLEASNFASGGHKLNAKKSNRNTTPQASTPARATSTDGPAVTIRRMNGPQPLRLPPGKLFFGYEIKPVKKSSDKKELDSSKPHFSGQGQTLSGKTRKADSSGATATVEDSTSTDEAKPPSSGRTLRDTPK